MFVDLSLALNILNLDGWILDFLTDRTQTVDINGLMSDQDHQQLPKRICALTLIYPVHK